MKLIAEVGNNHFGNFAMAKELIMAASDSGAYMVKLQAFEPKDIVGGSMPKEFYEQCAFTFEQYKELIFFGREKGIAVFYSIFSESLVNLRHFQRWHKISGKQTIEAVNSNRFIDSPFTYISFPKSHLVHAYGLQNAIPLYVSDYMVSDPELFRLEYLAKITPGKPFGYSDHTLGTDACEIAVKSYGARVIEKHFTLEKNIKFQGQVFRDTIHGATPKEFRFLASQIKV